MNIRFLSLLLLCLIPLSQPYLARSAVAETWADENPSIIGWTAPVKQILPLFRVKWRNSITC